MRLTAGVNSAAHLAWGSCISAQWSLGKTAALTWQDGCKQTFYLPDEFELCFETELLNFGFFTLLSVITAHIFNNLSADNFSAVFTSIMFFPQTITLFSCCSLLIITLHPFQTKWLLLNPTTSWSWLSDHTHCLFVETYKRPGSSQSFM